MSIDDTYENLILPTETPKQKPPLATPRLPPRLTPELPPPFELKSLKLPSLLQKSPTNSTHSNGGNEARMDEINRIRNSLENAGLKRRKLYCHYKRLHKASNYISIGSSSISTTLITIAAANSANPIVFLPLSITSGVFGLIGGISTGLTKVFSKRFRKHDKIGLLANTTLCNINEMLSESLRDYKISHKEFTMINNIYQDFLRSCRNTKDNISKKNLIEREELLKTVSNIVNTKFLK